MPHELDTTKSFISAREPAWHRLGTVKDSWFTAEEALTEALLGYRVTKVPVEAVKEVDGQTIRIQTKDFYATVRQHPETGEWQVLGVVGADYEVFQNADAFAFMDDVVGNIGGAHYETAGALRGGRQIFLSVSTESADTIVLDSGGRNDHIKTYILCFTSHDGSLALTVCITPVRVVCANTLGMAIRGGNGSTGRFVTRHVGDIQGRVAEARSTLGVYRKHIEVVERVGTEMIQAEMTDNLFSRVLEDLFVVEDTPGVKEADREAMDKVRGLYELSPTCSNIIGTLWGGFQATVEYADWVTTVRGGKTGDVSEMRFRRQMGLDGNTGAYELKQRAFDRFYAEVTR